jgi:hypothetical protein
MYDTATREREKFFGMLKHSYQMRCIHETRAWFPSVVVIVIFLNFFWTVFPDTSPRDKKLVFLPTSARSFANNFFDKIFTLKITIKFRIIKKKKLKITGSRDASSYSESLFSATTLRVTVDWSSNRWLSWKG